MSFNRIFDRNASLENEHVEPLRSSSSPTNICVMILPAPKQTETFVVNIRPLNTTAKLTTMTYYSIYHILVVGWHQRLFMRLGY